MSKKCKKAELMDFSACRYERLKAKHVLKNINVIRYRKWFITSGFITYRLKCAQKWYQQGNFTLLNLYKNYDCTCTKMWNLGQKVWN